MKRRYLYMLLFALPGLLVALLLSAMLFAALAGALWLFVFGDSPWPSTAETLLTAGFVLVWAALWGAVLYLAYRTGRAQELQATLNRAHLWSAAGVTALLVAVLLLQQWRVGNLGTTSSAALCADYCQRQGFAASGFGGEDVASQTCRCYDARGDEAVVVPIEVIRR